MNWVWIKSAPWLDTRARFVAAAPPAGALLDLGSSDGETLGHIAELRSDLRLFAADKSGEPEKYPAGCQFQKVDLEREKLPWPEHSMDAITCMHVVEHLSDLTSLLAEVARLLKPGGRAYFETPHPKSLTLASPRGAAAGPFT
jgi:SAM-dependent methyltransferase